MRNKSKIPIKRAVYRLSSKLQNKKKRWHFWYVIDPPRDLPFLPSDETLRTVIERYNRIRFAKCERLPDHDVLIVRGVEDNMFRTIAESEQKLVRRLFLSEIGSIALPAREIKQVVLEELERLSDEESLENITWNGKHLIARTRDDKRRESHIWGKCLDPFKQLSRLCKTELPFFYEAAP